MKRAAIVAELRELQAYAYGSEQVSHNLSAKEDSRSQPFVRLGVLQARCEILATKLDALAEEIRKPTRRVGRR